MPPFLQNCLNLNATNSWKNAHCQKHLLLEKPNRRGWSTYLLTSAGVVNKCYTTDVGQKFQNFAAVLCERSLCISIFKARCTNLLPCPAKLEQNIARLKTAGYAGGWVSLHQGYTAPVDKNAHIS